MNVKCQDCNEIVPLSNLSFVITFHGQHKFLCHNCLINEENEFEKGIQKELKLREEGKIKLQIRKERTIDFHKRRMDFFYNLDNQ